MMLAYLQSVEQDIQSTGNVDSPRARVSVEGIDNTEQRSKESVGDTSLGGERGVIENGSSGCLQILKLEPVFSSSNKLRYSPQIQYRQW